MTFLMKKKGSIQNYTVLSTSVARKSLRLRFYSSASATLNSIHEDSSSRADPSSWDMSHMSKLAEVEEETR